MQSKGSAFACWRVHQAGGRSAELRLLGCCSPLLHPSNSALAQSNTERALIQEEIGLASQHIASDGQQQHTAPSGQAQRV